MDKQYIIFSTRANRIEEGVGYWNELFGWTTIYQANIYTDDEISKFDLLVTGMTDAVFVEIDRINNLLDEIRNICLKGKTMKEDEYVIYSPNEFASNSECGFWNNDNGWVNIDNATIFTNKEKEELCLPVAIGDDARWVSAKQFLDS